MARVTEGETEGESRQDHARAIIDPTRPDAGKGGVVPPEQFRWQKGRGSPNPGGKPKGCFSARRALQRELAKGYESDSDAATDDERIGAKARQLAIDLYSAARDGDVNRVTAITKLIAEAEGTPLQELKSTQEVWARTEMVFVEPPIPQDQAPPMPGQSDDA